MPNSKTPCSFFEVIKESNKSNTHKPSNPSHEVSLTTDGGATFHPLYRVGGYSPWDNSTATAPFLSACSLPLNLTTRLVLYLGQIKAPWETPASYFALVDDDGTIGRTSIGKNDFDVQGSTQTQVPVRYGVLSDRVVRYHGVDTLCNGTHMWIQAVVEDESTSSDGQQRWLLSAQCHHGSMPVFESTDGFDWFLRSYVEAPPGCRSAGENTIVRLNNTGSLLLIARCDSDLPLHAWISSDDGAHWSPHTLPAGMKGVMPVAIRMDSGGIVLATGRGGLAIWFNQLGDGQDWHLYNLAVLHNELILQNKAVPGAKLQ